MRTGFEASGTRVKRHMSEGVQTYVVQELYQVVNRRYAKVFDPVTGDYSDFAPVCCGDPDNLRLHDDPVKEFENQPNSCLQAVCVRRAGSRTPIVIGWINPVDSLRNSGRRPTGSGSGGGSGGGGTTPAGGSTPTGSVPDHITGCNHVIGFTAPAGASYKSLSIYNNTALASSTAAAQVTVDDTGRGEICVHNSDNSALQYIGFMLFNYGGGDNRAHSGGIVGFNKANIAGTYVCDLTEELPSITNPNTYFGDIGGQTACKGGMMPAIGENLAECLSRMYDAISNLRDEVNDLKNATTSAVGIAGASVAGAVTSAAAKTAITTKVSPLQSKEEMIAHGINYSNAETEDHIKTAYLVPWVRTARVP